MIFTINIDESLQWRGIAEIKFTVLNDCANPLETLTGNEQLLYKALPFGEPFTTSQAEALSKQFSIKRGRLFRMLSDKRFFHRVGHGVLQRTYAGE
jgi:hypothetical protein